MSCCQSCGTNVVVASQKKTVNPCDPVQPPCPPPLCPSCVACKPQPVCVPECRKSIRDVCRTVKPCPPCKCEPCKPKNCVRKTKCKFYSVKDKLRVKPCPPVKECCCSGSCSC